MRDLTDTSGRSRPDGEKPDFSNWEDPEEMFEGGSTRERLMDVIMQVREPTKVSSIAEHAGCDTETARDYLDWFADLGLVRKHSNRPTQYERNESFLRWRQVEQIRSQHSDEEILDELKETIDSIREYQERFGEDEPGQVSLKEASETATVEDLWDDLSEWQTLEERAELLETALREEKTSGSLGTDTDTCINA
ncbi:MAG: hypothetical protein SV253_10180 [Halobacteria archaeon]|nr:hypothetical protein [Halobacteria archaeon]